MCVPAKAGSTSFYFWLYHALAGEPWPYSGPPWIQDVSSSRWSNVSGVRVARFDKMPFRQRIRALSDQAVLRFALTRDPLERAISAYYSKMACDTGDAADHGGAIRQLMRQAPKAAAAGLGAGSDLNRSVPCLSAFDWGRMVLEARLGETTRWEVNAHFMPQSDACGLHTLGYHYLIPLADNAYGMARIADALGVTGNARAEGKQRGGATAGGTVPKLAKRHVVSKGDKRALSDEAMALLAKVYVQDINLLQFPPASNWSSSRANGSAAAELVRRAGSSKGRGGKAVGKAKGRGAGGAGGAKAGKSKGRGGAGATASGSLSGGGRGRGKGRGTLMLTRV